MNGPVPGGVARPSASAAGCQPGGITTWSGPVIAASRKLDGSRKRNFTEPSTSSASIAETARYAADCGAPSSRYSACVACTSEAASAHPPGQDTPSRSRKISVASSGVSQPAARSPSISFRCASSPSPAASVTSWL